jgi:hypothetical protein
MPLTMRKVSALCFPTKLILASIVLEGLRDEDSIAAARKNSSRYSPPWRPAAYRSISGT